MKNFFSAMLLENFSFPKKNTIYLDLHLDPSQMQ